MPFLKFFNYGESNGADVDWSKPVRVMDKGVCVKQFSVLIVQRRRAHRLYVCVGRPIV